MLRQTKFGTTRTSHSNPKSPILTAPKKPTALEQPPRADSSSEDEEEVSNEEEDEEEEVVSEESEEEEEPKKTDPKSDSSSSSEEEYQEVTPVAPVKPVEVQSPKMGAKRKQKQPDVAPATASASKLGIKRPIESKADGMESKKLRKVEDKRVAEEEEEEVVVKKVGEDTKKQLFQTMFSEEDEIEMLKALLDYSAKKCIDPIEDFNDFHDFVKKSIHVDVSSAQLGDKIRRMKKKVRKECKQNKEREEHSEAEYDFELAKTKDVVGMMGLRDDLLKKGFELLNDEARAALEEKWKKIATAELELYYNRLELSRERVKLSLDALKASGHRG
ncbi:hypothetical protein QQ045_010623 [Rhodiola kirilowii]